MQRQVIFLLLLVSGNAAVALAEVKTRPVAYKHGELQLEGHFAWDDAVAGQRPGVLIVHEWWGLDAYARRRAFQLASMGYAAFAIDMYGKGKLAKHPNEASGFAAEVRKNVATWQERAKLGLEILKSQPQCDPKNIAAIGYCFGGSTALQLAYTGADLKAVVTFHAALPAPAEGEAAKIKPRILVCHGAADSFIPDDAIARFRKALDDAKVDWTMVYYSGARHSFTVPEADSHGVDGLKYDKLADERSWQHMQDLFNEVFKASRPAAQPAK
jgi:dienelactone hydrolase